MKFYIATRLENADAAKALAGALRELGHTITYEWWTHGSVQGADPTTIRRVATAELKGVREADVLIALLPGGRGTHAELGAALVLEKPVWLCAPLDSLLYDLGERGDGATTCAFYWHPSVMRRFTGSLEGLVGALRQDVLRVTEALIAVRGHV